MNKSKVRCWPVRNYHGNVESDTLYLAYPEDNSGYSLISCLRCGHIYSVSVAREVYVGPVLSEKLKSLTCTSCGMLLAESAAPYPDQYVSNGVVIQFDRPIELPDDENSVILEFDEIYS